MINCKSFKTQGPWVGRMTRDLVTFLVWLSLGTCDDEGTRATWLSETSRDNSSFNGNVLSSVPASLNILCFGHQNIRKPLAESVRSTCLFSLFLNLPNLGFVNVNPTFYISSLSHKPQPPQQRKRLESPNPAYLPPLTFETPWY